MTTQTATRKATKAAALACYDGFHGVRRLFNGGTLAEEFGATSRTIKRDIDFLRQRGWVIEWVHDEHTYDLKRAPRAIL